MSNSEYITVETHLALREAITTYVAEIAVPKWMANTTAFAEAYSGTRCEGRTLITASGHSLAYGTHDNEDRPFLFLIIDASGDAPAAVVKQGFYDLSGNVDVKEGSLKCPVAHILTELEGQALIADLHDLIDRTPQ